MNSAAGLKIRLVKTLDEVGESRWRSLESEDFPFNDFNFFKALADSGSIGRGSGWDAHYLLAEDEAGTLLGLLYTFVKTHSYGEYIFDWQWANFYRVNGEHYYPKLMTAVPFTPATGPRILLSSNCDGEVVTSALIQSALEISRRAGLSSYHALFMTEGETSLFERNGMAVRHSLQYHWHNPNLKYRHFEDFLESLVGKRRRDIQRERKRAQSHGLSIRKLSGESLQEDHADIMESLYRRTTDKKNAIAYLQPDFFRAVFKSMSNRILFVLAEKDGVPVAGALNFFKGKKLYGRYWGSHEDFADLHFELCYYQTIEFALEQRFEVFEAGAQGEHKIQRGFLPSLTYSAHKIFDPRFELAITNFIREERAALLELKNEFSSPYRQT